MKRNAMKRIGIIAAGMTLSLAVVTSSSAETLTATTTLTIVNVTTFLYSSADLTDPQWVEAGQWPTADSTLTSDGEPNTEGYQCYLDSVSITSSNISWNTTPYSTPYDNAPGNSINSMITTVYSTDGGVTFNLGTWDYLTASTHSKSLEEGADACWQGTIINTLQDNGKSDSSDYLGYYRTNLYFKRASDDSTFPTCWTADLLNADISDEYDLD